MKNIEIDNINKQITLKFNMDLYKYKAIVRALKEFSENFWVIMYGSKNDEIIVNLKPKQKFINDVNLNELGYEFYNYTLGLMQI